MDPRYLSDTQYFNTAYVQTGLTPYLNGTINDQNVFDSEYAAHSMEHNDFSAQAMSLPMYATNSVSDGSETSYNTQLLGRSSRLHSSSSSASSQSPVSSTQENPQKTLHRGAGNAIQATTIPEEQEEPTDPSNSAKRSKFLERNRLAAAKCRTKKKRWTNNLEAAARQASQQTRELHAIVQNLRDEVLQYKTELMNHQNCECHEIQDYLYNEHSHTLQASNTASSNGQ